MRHNRNTMNVPAVVLWFCLLSGCLLLRSDGAAETPFDQGVAFLKANQPDQAIEAFTAALAAIPDHYKAYNNRGVAWFSKGDYDRAIADYTRALEKNPFYAEAYNNRGAAWFAKGDYPRAIADYAGALEKNVHYAEAYNNRGAAWFAQGDYDRAIADYSLALEEDPGYAKAYVYRGAARFKKGAYPQAIADYRRALDVRPDYAEAYNQLAWCLATCPDATYRNGVEAVELAKKAIRIETKPGFLDTLAAAHAEAGAYDAAVSVQREVLRLMREHGEQPLQEFESRLFAYQGRRAWREERVTQTAAPPPPARKPEPGTGARPESKASRKTPYTLHLSSHRDPARALRQVDQLNTRGRQAFSCPARIPGKGLWYRVFSGAFETLADARKEARRLKGGGTEYVQVFKAPYAIAIPDSAAEREHSLSMLRSQGFGFSRPAGPRRSAANVLLAGAYQTEGEAQGMAGGLRRIFPQAVVVRR